MTEEDFPDRRTDFSLKSEQAAALLGLFRAAVPVPFSTPFVASWGLFSNFPFSVDSSPFFCGFALHLFVPENHHSENNQKLNPKETRMINKIKKNQEGRNREQ
jgi:hypothetical protein